MSIDIQGLKQILWERSDGTNLDELQPPEIVENIVKWIDTSCMIVDCLTEKMKPYVLIKLMKMGKIKLKPSVESQMLKLQKSKQRRAKKEKEQMAK